MFTHQSWRRAKGSKRAEGGHHTVSVGSAQVACRQEASACDTKQQLKVIVSTSASRPVSISAGATVHCT